MKISPEEEKRYAQLQNLALDFARHGKKDELSKMLHSGLPVNLSDHKGNSLLMLATYNNQYETSKMLIENGAIVDKKNDRGQTPLAGVCFKGYLDIVKLLVENNANIHADNGMGTTPIDFAAMFGHKKIVEYLLEKNSKKPNVVMRFFSFLSPLILKLINRKKTQ